MLNQLTFSILEQYEQYIESLIQLSMFKTQNYQFEQFAAKQFDLDIESFLPLHLLDKLNESDWLKKMMLTERSEDLKSREKHLAELESIVAQKHNDLYLYLNTLDKTEVIKQIYPNFPFSIAIVSLRQHINNVLELREHRFPLVYFIREIIIQGHSFSEQVLSFDLRYYELDLMSFFDRVDSHVIRIRNLEPLQLSYHYYIAKAFTSRQVGVFDDLMKSCFAMIGNAGSSIYNGVRYFSLEKQPVQTKKIGGKIITIGAKSDNDFNRISVKNNNQPVSSVGFYCIGEINATQPVSYMQCIDNTCHALNRQYDKIVQPYFLGKTPNTSSSVMLYELFFDYPISDNWSLSHKAFFLRYGVASHFDYYINAIFQDIYASVDIDMQQSIQSFGSWQKKVEEFIDENADLDVSEEALNAMSDGELIYLVNDRFYNHQNISAPVPFITPNALSREELFNKRLNYDWSFFELKLEKLNKPLFEYIKTLEVDKRSIHTIIESVLNTQSDINKRIRAGLDEQMVLPDNVLSETILYQFDLVKMIQESFARVIDYPLIIPNSNDSSKDYSIVCSLQFNNHFSNQLLDGYKIHQLDDFSLDFVFALLPVKADRLTDELLSNSLYVQRFKIPRKAQMYSLSFWSSYPELLSLAANNNGLLKRFEERFDVPLNDNFVVISKFV